MLKRLFLDHPASVGESYTEHLAVAARFGGRLLWGGLRCTVHAVFPFLCRTAGSDTVRELHAQLVEKRAAQAQMTSVEYVI